ncbi:MAG: VWA domain-containing protein [Deltaproteobacteria bacterium]|nr:VWA domain-containing protein [Deltaproteobacteria bacterium]
MKLFKSISVTCLAVSMLCVCSVRAEQVKLDVAVSHPLMLAEKKQTAYLKIGLTGVAVARELERPPVNVAIVLDRSGSMSGKKIQRAKEAAILAIDRLSSNDIVSVVAYNQNVSVLVPATKVSDRHKIFDAINRLSPGGMTALFGGVSKGAHEVKKFLVENQVNRVILMSDGLANVGPSSPDALAALGSSLIKEGISVTTIGLGLGYNEDLMVKLARASDGNHAFVEGPEQLAQIFNYEFNDILSVVANEVEITIKCAEGIRPVRVLGRNADIVGQSVSTKINQLYGKQEKYILLEVEVSKSPAGRTQSVAVVSVNYSDLVTKKHARLNGATSVTFTGSAKLVRDNTNAKVMIAAVEQIANYTNRRALELRDQGKISEAQKVLIYNGKYLFDNAKIYKSPRLRRFGEGNKADADNLDPGKWDRQRKKMRKLHHEIDMQQYY